MRVVLADDSVVIRSGLTTLLSSAGIDVVAVASDGTGLLEAVRVFSPDVAIVDIRMPPTFTDEGLVAARRIRSEFPGVAVVVLSQYVAAAYATRLLEQTPSGVGYLLKDRVSDVRVLVDALRRVVAGGRVIDQAIVDRLMARQQIRETLGRLTPRERQVLGLMAGGYSNHAIAEQLGLSPKTLETHIGRVFDKLGIAAEPHAHRRVLAVLAHLRGVAR